MAKVSRKASLSLIPIAALLSGCISGPPVSLPIQAVPTKRLSIYWTHAYNYKGGILITGQVRPRPLDFGPFWGHLHIQAEFHQGRAPLVVDSGFGTISRRGSRSASFTALLRVSDPAAIKSVRIEYRTERDAPETEVG